VARLRYTVPFHERIVSAEYRDQTFRLILNLRLAEKPGMTMTSKTALTIRSWEGTAGVLKLMNSFLLGYASTMGNLWEGLVHTLVEGRRELKGVDELRVESRCNLNTHAADEEVKVHPPQVRLLVPWHLVLFDHARNNGISSMPDVWCLEDTHDGGIAESPKVGVTVAKLCGSQQYLYP
jgi:hypothetical protein